LRREGKRGGERGNKSPGQERGALQPEEEISSPLVRYQHGLGKKGKNVGKRILRTWKIEAQSIMSELKTFGESALLSTKRRER